MSVNSEEDTTLSITRNFPQRLETDIVLNSHEPSFTKCRGQNRPSLHLRTPERNILLLRVTVATETLSGSHSRRRRVSRSYQNRAQASKNRLELAAYQSGEDGKVLRWPWSVQFGDNCLSGNHGGWGGVTESRHHPMEPVWTCYEADVLEPLASGNHFTNCRWLSHKTLPASVTKVCYIFIQSPF